MSFSQLGLIDRLVDGVRAAGYADPTSIQSQAIPHALDGRDLVGLAHTGTGKTAAFALPMLQRLLQRRNGHRAVRGLILTPTRELAKQVEDSITSVGRYIDLHTLSVYGGVSMENQIKRLQRGIDIVVATPGRLLDHLSRRTVSLSHVEMLVLDEADRMFDMGFINDVRKIVTHIPRERQTLLFSATMPEPIRNLTVTIQKNPVTVQVGTPSNPAETITQYFYSVPQEQKLDLLAHIVEKEQMECLLVFARTKRGADRISKNLERRGLSTVALHSDRTQAQRQRALAGFKEGRFRVMVATDIAARGIDVEGISHVVNFDTPAFAEDYIHRVGRTGRAEATGDAITFVSGAERGYLRSIEKLIGKRLELKVYKGFDPTKSAVEQHHNGVRKPRHEQTQRHSERREHPHRTKHENGNRRQEGQKQIDNRSRHEIESERRQRSGPRDQRHGRGGRDTRQFGNGRTSGGSSQVQMPQPPAHSERRTSKSDWMELISAGEEMGRSVSKKFKRFFGTDSE
jgi:ATP-dependent RNA helicase RhlE